MMSIIFDGFRGNNRYPFSTSHNQYTEKSNIPLNSIEVHSVRFY